MFRPSLSLTILFATILPSVLATHLTSSSLVTRTVSNATFDERSGILTLPSSSPLSPMENDDASWFPASIGMMLERSLPPTKKMIRRAISTTNQIRTRDTHTERAEVGVDPRGNFIWPDSWEEGTNSPRLEKKHRHAHKASRKSAKKSKSKSKAKAKSKKGSKKKSGGVSLGAKLAASIPKFLATITWYTGHDLLNPYCAQKSGWTPSDGSMIAAVTEQWGKNRPECGSFLQLKAPKAEKAVVVRVVDLCGGCKPGVPHVDLSITAFKALYDLNVGLVTDIEVSTLSGAPVNGDWTSNLLRLYGPQDL